MKKHYYLLSIFLIFCVQTYSQTCDRVCNSDFENDLLATPGSLSFVTSFDLDCWQTTAFDGVIEVWGDGCEGVPAFSGGQFIELNANVVSTLYQDISVVPGETFNISFAHRGRWGIDVLSLSIGPIGGPFTNLGNFTADETAWISNNLSYTFPNNGVTNYSLQFNSVSSTGGMPSVGNFLDAISVSTANAINVSLLSNDIVCNPNLTMGSISASVTGNIGNLTYTWTPNISTTSSASNLLAGNYQVIVADSIGCVDTAQVTIIGQIPTLTISQDVEACIGTSVQFSATGNGTVSWNNGIVNNVDFSPVVGVTDYIATVTLSNGCQLSDTVQTLIHPNPIPVFSSNKQQGCESLSLTFTNFTPITQTCFWDFGNGETSIATANEDITYVFDGLYTVSLLVVDQHGCQGTTVLPNYITVFPNPIASFSSSSDYFGFDISLISFENESVDATTYNWTLEEFDSTTEINPTFNFGSIERDVTVQLVASNQFGCMDSTTKILLYKNIETFYVPNTFTPDGNHFNNTFGPVFSPGFTMTFYQLKVYDRWGEILFESFDPQASWDGSYGDKLVPDGTYVWEMVLHDNDLDKKKFTGHLTLMK